jgi:rod shape-determining protein MreC
VDERRTAWLFVFVLVAQLLLVAAQVPSEGGYHSRLEAGALRAVAPLAQAVSKGVGALEDLGQGFRLRRSLEAENRRLLDQNQHLKLELLRLQDLKNQLQPLAAAVHYTPPQDFDMQVADVLYVDHASWIRTLVLYTPESTVQANQAVVTADGLVGRIVLVTGPYAKVQLLTDRAASIGAMVQRTRRQGLVQGTAREGLQLSFLPRQSDVKVGDRVVTSGIDGIFPRGIPIGTVSSVETGNDLFQKIRLTSAVDFGTLDHAYVLLRGPVPEATREALPGTAPEPNEAAEPLAP